MSEAARSPRDLKELAIQANINRVHLELYRAASEGKFQLTVQVPCQPQECVTRVKESIMADFTIDAAIVLQPKANNLQSIIVKWH